VLNEAQFILHLIPSGILHRGKICIIGNGVALDPAAFLEEISELKAKGIEVTRKNLVVSEDAHVIFPYHKKLDSLREIKRGGTKLGTTKRGIGPCYADKVSRCGIRVIDLMDPQIFKEKLQFNIKEKNTLFKHLYHSTGLSFNKIYLQYRLYANRIRNYVGSASLILNDAIKKKQNILFEGAQGTLLDIDHGTYPFVTSSNATAGGACIGTGVGPTHINRIIGVAKAYTTRVGEGPFPTEFSSTLMERVRRRGKEFGATTGRPRRCGWFDSVIVKHAVMVNAIDEIVITKLDVLDDMPKIKLCIGYKVGRKVHKTFPTDLKLLKRCKPVYEEHRGWQRNTSSIKSFQRLPGNAKRYLHRLKELLGVKIRLISVGSDREQVVRW
jgi:adenylosuccinate synthase